MKSKTNCFTYGQNTEGIGRNNFRPASKLQVYLNLILSFK